MSFPWLKHAAEPTFSAELRQRLASAAELPGALRARPHESELLKARTIGGTGKVHVQAAGDLGFGLFASKALEPGEFVAEWIGSVVGLSRDDCSFLAAQRSLKGSRRLKDGVSGRQLALIIVDMYAISSARANIIFSLFRPALPLGTCWGPSLV